MLNILSTGDSHIYRHADNRRLGDDSERPDMIIGYDRECSLSRRSLNPKSTSIKLCPLYSMYLYDRQIPTEPRSKGKSLTGATLLLVLNEIDKGMKNRQCVHMITFKAQDAGSSPARSAIVCNVLAVHSRASPKCRCTTRTTKFKDLHMGLQRPE
jgi:hypothetical protein